MSTTLLTAFLSGLLGSPCPDASHLADGILIEETVGGQTMMHAHVVLGDGIIWSSFAPDLTRDTWQSYHYEGLFELQTARTSGAEMKQVLYDTDLPSLFPLIQGARHALTFWHQSADGLRFDWDVTLTVGAAAEAVIGDCRYDAQALRMESSLERSDGTTSDGIREYLWIPELHYALPTYGGTDHAMTGIRPMRWRDPFDPQPVPDHAKRSWKGDP